MTFGVDECRKCGKRMKITSANAMVEYEKSLRTPPTMTEAEWRAAGWKAMPTHVQMYKPMNGLCKECHWNAARNKSNLPGMMISLCLAGILLLGIIVFIVSRGS